MQVPVESDMLCATFNCTKGHCEGWPGCKKNHEDESKNEPYSVRKQYQQKKRAEEKRMEEARIDAPQNNTREERSRREKDNTTNIFNTTVYSYL